MKFFIATVAAILIPAATASVANYGPTNQSITLTGLGENPAGLGEIRVTSWGSCSFNGTNTVCTVTAPFTGVGSGGTVSYVLTYPGNGAAPLTATQQSAGSSTLGPFSLTSGSFVTTLTLTDGPTLTFDGEAPTLFYGQAGDATPQCTGVSTCGVGPVAQSAGATITGQVSGAFDPTPVIQTLISLSAYGGYTSIAPGTWVEIHGQNLATNPPPATWTAANFNGINAPTSLGGSTVTIGGQPAFVEYVSPTQINAQVPSNVATGLQSAIVTTAGGSSLPFSVQVNAIEPGLLAPSVLQSGGFQYVTALFPDGVTYVLPPGVTNVVATRRASPGDTIVLYGIGFGPVVPNIPAGEVVQQSNALQLPVQIFFGGTPVKVTYQGLNPSVIGLYQFNVVVPQIAPSDSVPVTFSVGNVVSSQTMVIAIGN